MLPDEFIMTAGNPNQQYIAKRHEDHYRIWSYPTTDKGQFAVWDIGRTERYILNGMWSIVFNTDEDEQISDVSSIL